MAAPSYTYSLTNGATADASQVMQNYNDILNGVTDGTKDLTISALTCNGAVSFKGTVSLGDASADDITVTGSLASSIPIKTTNTYDIGSATIGLRAAYFGANSQTAKIVGNTAMAGAVVLTLPPTTATLSTLALVETLTNKTLTGNTAVNLISGSGTLTLNTSGTATIPNATDTLVGTATTDVFTNKDITAASNTYRAASVSADGAVSTSAQTFNGAKTFDDGVLFTQTASSGTPVSVLSSTQQAYEEISFTSTISNLSSGTPAILFKLGRTGKNATIRVTTQVSVTKSGTSDPAVVDALPTTFRPSDSTYIPWGIRNNNIYEIGFLNISTGGVLTFQRSTLGVWTNGAAADIVPAAGSYQLF